MSVRSASKSLPMVRKMSQNITIEIEIERARAIVSILKKALADRYDAAVSESLVALQSKIDACNAQPSGYWIIKILNFEPPMYAVSYGAIGPVERAKKWLTKEDALLWAHGALEIGAYYEAVFIRDS